MDKYIETKGMKLISKSGYDKYPYLLEVTEFVKNSNIKMIIKKLKTQAFIKFLLTKKNSES